MDPLLYASAQAPEGSAAAAVIQAAPKVNSSSSKDTTEPFNKVQRTEKSKISPPKDFPSRNIFSHIDVIISGQTDPCHCKAKHRSSKGQDTGSFSSSHSHGHVDEIFGAQPSDDTENNENHHPTESFKVVHEFVSQECDHKRCKGDDNDADYERTFAI